MLLLLLEDLQVVVLLRVNFAFEVEEAQKLAKSEKEKVQICLKVQKFGLLQHRRFLAHVSQKLVHYRKELSANFVEAKLFDAK